MLSIIIIIIIYMVKAWYKSHFWQFMPDYCPDVFIAFLLVLYYPNSSLTNNWILQQRLIDWFTDITLV